MKFDVMRRSGKDQVTGEYKDLKRLNYLIVPCEALLSVHPLKVMPSSTCLSESCSSLENEGLKTSHKCWVWWICLLKFSAVFLRRMVKL